MSDLPKRVDIHEEGPREGFQIEPGPISTERKIALVDALSETGLKRIQIASFVNPKRVPGWADAEAVVHGVRRRDGVRYTALWLNEKGLERAIALKDRLSLRGVISLCASEPFMERNQNRGLAENARPVQQPDASRDVHGQLARRVHRGDGLRQPAGEKLRVAEVVQRLEQLHRTVLRVGPLDGAVEAAARRGEVALQHVEVAAVEQDRELLLRFGVRDQLLGGVQLAERCVEAAAPGSDEGGLAVHLDEQRGVVDLLGEVAGDAQGGPAAIEAFGLGDGRRDADGDGGHGAAQVRRGGQPFPHRRRPA